MGARLPHPGWRASGSCSWEVACCSSAMPVRVTWVSQNQGDCSLVIPLRFTSPASVSWVLLRLSDCGLVIPLRCTNPASANGVSIRFEVLQVVHAFKVHKPRVSNLCTAEVKTL